MKEIWENIPTWDNGTWTTLSFNSRDEFTKYIESLFLEPGKYAFDETSNLFNEEATKFNSTGVYCTAPFKSKDFISYWEDQKAKCRKGVFFKNGKKTWYLTREYYMWLNFLPIFDKEEQSFGFAKIRDAQYHMALYELLAELNYKHAAILKKRQIASEQPHSEPVLGEHGWTTMGEIQPGDKLWNPDGTLTTILNKSNNGLSDVYEFTFGDGRSTRCGIEHNWEVYDKAAKKTKVLNTKQLLEIGIFSTPIKGKNKIYDNYRFAIKTTEAIPFTNNNDLPIHPYVLGCILGDGHINKTVYISGNDEEIFDEIALSLGEDYELVDNGYCKKLIKYKKRFSEDCLKYDNGKFGCNPLLRALDELGLRKNNKSLKHIPDIYKHASINARIELLQGLMDTDGYVNAKGNNIHFTNTNKTLIDDVVYIARSLGLKVTVVKKDNKKQNTFYRVLFSGKITFELFKLSRKQWRLIKRGSSKTFDLVPLTSIKKLNYQEESSCIVVDNPNHLYITKDFIVTHNSYYHMGKFINQLWFEQGAILKMGASLKDYINEKGSWKFLDEYAAFLNEHTAWYRPLNPKKVMMWQQKIEVTKNQRKTEAGLKGVIQGMSFEKDPTNGVGGPVKYFFHEEAGIAPKMDETFGYIKPALKSGMITTGMFIAAGSVGDLSQCQPLKDMIEKPEGNSIYAVETNLIDEKGTIGMTGLFIPEQWSMPPYIDKYGNSLVEESLKALDEYFETCKREMTPEAYQLELSQHPRNIKEAFANRSVSVFPTHLISAQERRIKDKEYSFEFLDLSRTENGKIVANQTSKLPISQFPVDKKMEDKSGVFVVWERPVKDPSFGMYYASIDPVSEGKTTTSDSLCSIYVMKAPVEVTKINGVETESYIEQDKIVATWCGRYDDINKTHQKLELIIEWYNARTVVENNISLFIQYMISRKKQRYLVPRTEIMFLKDLGSNANVFQEYGWRNTGRLFKDHLLSYVIEYTKEELDNVTKEDGTIVKTIYGIERIPDPMLLKEMAEYTEGLNVDRLVSFAALVAFMRIQQSNRGYNKIVIKDEAAKNLDKSNNLYKLSSSPFRNLGKGKMINGQRFNKSPFKNLK